MSFNPHTSHHPVVLEHALEKLLGLSHLYLKLLPTVRTQKVRETLEKLALEKERHAQLLEEAISRCGGDVRGVRIPLDHPVSADRELIPWIYQEEQALSLWVREQISTSQHVEVKALLQTLLRDEDQYLKIVKDLYRNLAYC